MPPAPLNTTLGGSEAVSCNASTTTIGSAAEASAMADACPTYTGDVAIATSTTDNLDFNGLQEIQGSFIAVNVTEVTVFSSSTLQTITGDLGLEALTILSIFNFTQLQSVRGVYLSAIPALQAFTLLQTLVNVSTISIENTQINALQGFNLPTVDTLVVENNPYMESINLQPYNITGELIIEANGRALDVSMPNIQSAQKMTFRNCSSISIPSLTQINGTLELDGNYITSFNGAPLLQAVGGGISFVNNPQLTNISLPELQTIAGGFEVVNNTDLTTLAPLYSLTSITGDVDLNGTFTDISFPALKEVQGSFEVMSSGALSCNAFDTLSQDSVIKGQYTCETATDTANKTATSNSTSTNPGTSSQPTQSANSGGLSTGAKAGLGVGIGGGCLLLIALLTWFLLRRRQKRRSALSNKPLAEVDGAPMDRAAMLGNEGEKHELEQPAEELPAGVQAQELPAKHGQTELGRSATSSKPPGIESRHEMPANETPLPTTRKNEDEEDR